MSQQSPLSFGTEAAPSCPPQPTTPYSGIPPHDLPTTNISEPSIAIFDSFLILNRSKFSITKSKVND